MVGPILVGEICHAHSLPWCVAKAAENNWHSAIYWYMQNPCWLGAGSVMKS